MDEEALRNDFFEWLENVFEPRLRAEKRMRWNDCSVEAWLEATRRAEEKSAIRISELEAALTGIALYAHDNSTGPTVSDQLWEIRRIAYDAL